MKNGPAIPPKVFLVEDEVLVAFEMAETLRDFGFDVVGPSLRLEDGKEKAMAAEIDVALLDINLGRGTTSEPIADILRARNIPLVFMTAYDRTQIAFIHHDDALIRKPVYGSDLNSVLMKMFSTRNV